MVTILFRPQYVEPENLYIYTMFTVNLQMINKESRWNS